MSDDVLAEASQEIAKAWRAGMQIAEFMAIRRQRELARAQRNSTEDERRLRQVIEGERRLAAPVYRAALDKGWWETASAEQAAHTHCVAVRFSRLDPQAEQAVIECERQARLKWNIDLAQTRRPLKSQDVDSKALAATAPAIAGEEQENWGQHLDQSAHDAPSEAQPATTEPVNAWTAERQAAWEWARQHYDVDGLWPRDPDHARQDKAHLLYSAMAAEGYDMNHPPELDDLSHDVPDTWKASVGASRDFARATGIEEADFERFIDPREIGTAHRVWAAERAGRYPDPQRIQWSLVKNSEAVQSVNTVRLPDAPERRGIYTELARRAAADEAEQAGMRPDEYLDHLNVHQRRMLVVSQGKIDSSYAQGMSRMSAYRIAYASQAASRWPSQEHVRDSLAQARRHLDVADEQRDVSATEETEARQLLGQGNRENQQSLTEHHHDGKTLYPRAEEEPSSHARRKSREKSETLHESAQRRAGTARALETKGLGQEKAAWDSQAAREKWAQQQIEAGCPPDAVRAAVTGRLALHEPASQLTKSPSRAGRRGRARAARQSAPRRHQQHGR